MKLKSISDIEKLPSVLGSNELSEKLIELIEIIRANNIAPLKGSEAINNLIGYRAYEGTESDLTLECSTVVFQWIEEIYDTKNKELLICNIANLANLSCKEAKIFIEKRLLNDISKLERQELIGALEEIRIFPET